jgi:hypothetical protein
MLFSTLVQGKAKLLQEETFMAFIVTFKPSKTVLVVEYSAGLSHVINFSYLNNMALEERKKQAQRQKKAFRDHSYIT